MCTLIPVHCEYFSGDSGIGVHNTEIIVRVEPEATSLYQKFVKPPHSRRIGATRETRRRVAAMTVEQARRDRFLREVLRENEQRLGTFRYISVVVNIPQQSGSFSL